MTDSKIRPMLATDANVGQLRYPLNASPKLDGIRAVIIDGKPHSRTLKTFPNAHVRQLFTSDYLTGFDGELIVGSPTAKDVCRVTGGAVARFDGEPDVQLYAFDTFSGLDLPYRARRELLCRRWAALPSHLHKAVTVLEQRIVNNERELRAYEDEQLALGYEGLILRDPEAPYKFGRSTVREGYLLKLKQFRDAEAVVIDFEEEMFNGNEAQTNELGRTKRSSAKAGLTGKGRLGALLVRDVTTGVEFKIGTGFTALDRTTIWNDQARFRGAHVKYKSFPIGVKEAPRHPVYLSFREAFDMEKAA